MCGIAGKLNFKNQSVDKTDILSMINEIKHRGPDDKGIYINNNIGLGHRRLSVIDLSKNGQQPMADESKRFWITYNGEIYNFLELKKNLLKDGIKFKSNTDTEVILYLYKKHGFACLKLLRGMFAFAIWDNEKKELFLARDRVGKKPLKYYLDDNVLIFSSELKAILKNKEVKKEIDWQAIDEFLTFKYVPAPRTGFKNIYKLLPAYYMTVKANGEKIIKQYWDLDFEKKLELSENDWQKKITEKLQKSVQARLISDVPLGVHLSGGIDSSLIVALMDEARARPIKTFSIGFKEKKYNELNYARLVAKKYNTDHQEFIIEPKAMEILPKLSFHYEEPYADASMLPSWYLSEMTKKHVTVALSGDGGDEVFAGYNRYLSAQLYFKLKKLPFKKLSANFNYLVYKATGNDIFYKASRQLGANYNSLACFYLSVIQYFSKKEKKQLSEKFLNSKINNSYTQKINNYNWLDQLLYISVKTHLPDDLLVKTDIASMAHGLEIRSPFLDQSLMELSAKMPANLKINGYSKKYILKKIAEKYIPRECVYRPKQGFSVPLDYWFRDELNNYLEENILNKNFLDFGFNKNFILKLLHNHKSGKDRNENQLFTLLMLSLWIRRWF
ncbi:asparagine synthase (glutamine-hydrolyzing) [Candidatus Parcubacteria bacterium]|nr:asparagine synthase (glutamine-hydrolyzing) [Candidatus Parcubacteria bacterium]